MGSRPEGGCGGATKFDSRTIGGNWVRSASRCAPLNDSLLIVNRPSSLTRTNSSRHRWFSRRSVAFEYDASPGSAIRGVAPRCSIRFSTGPDNCGPNTMGHGLHPRSETTRYGPGSPRWLIGVRRLLQLRQRGLRDRTTRGQNSDGGFVWMDQAHVLARGAALRLSRGWSVIARNKTTVL